jgi:hypothetical protein
MQEKVVGISVETSAQNLMLGGLKEHGENHDHREDRNPQEDRPKRNLLRPHEDE